MPISGQVCHKYDAKGLIDGLSISQECPVGRNVLVQGVSALPKYCTQMCIGFFLVAVVFSVLRDLLPKKYGAYVPIPMAAAIPFYIGAQLAVSPFFASPCLTGAPDFVHSWLHEKQEHRVGW